MNNLWIENDGTKPDEFEPGCALLLRDRRVIVARLDASHDWKLHGWGNDIIAWMPKRDVLNVLRSNYKESRS